MSDPPLTLKDAIDAMERRRMRLVEAMARLIDDVKTNNVQAIKADREEALGCMRRMAASCAPQDALKFHKLIMMAERLPPAAMMNIAPHVVGMIFHYDRFPFVVADFELAGAVTN